MNKFNIITLGCKVNQYESEVIARELESEGWVPANDNETADICIINTCTVTQKASMQSRQAIRQAIRSNPEGRVLVTGCYAQTEPDQIKKIKGVSDIIGHKDKHKIVENLKLETGNRKPDSQVSSFRFQVSNARTRPFLKIQDGCNTFCTYCIVPYARGRSRSMPFENVLQNIRQLKDAGFHEVVLTGIHLGCYGTDLSPATSLSELLHCIHDSDRTDRIRLSSIEPHEITDDIIELVAKSDTLCHHFHIPLQSGDDFILKQMHRPYTNAFFRTLITKIHEMMPDAAIGVDTLIGFPGETEQAFENTYATIKDLPVTYLHVFPFSSREGTPASTYPNKVPSKVIKTRCQKMRTLGNAKKNEFYRTVVGKSAEVLIESKRDKSSGLLKGSTSNYIPVLVNGGDELKNTLVSVRIEEVDDKNRVRAAI
ncbi:tRNA (N(6)-L-threonylcarbamoyladenosine(37)-C(2))-methylthiotransferase MtaB [Desulfonema magnum]|uniref:Threonylcarbamoyladenosine tRNA methylthiotransferase MtaB n=1 Tax=Desulfonema magnum TaxID=45655 RepID=A0A975GTG6_9BACT|nr:tRNA (N(6)-L-threonylcarbamoyladenosine(37)-C(2))-methylthiotransferase MtaB [Desulfonema magnum]QTA93105.1 tRNA-2-methylthio-N(6)-dimethylallyladenosine synthase [Desulfonema magnum]